MESFIKTEIDWFTNVTEVDVTAQVSSDTHLTPVNSGGISSCILTDIVYF